MAANTGSAWARSAGEPITATRDPAAGQDAVWSGKPDGQFGEAVGRPALMLVGGAGTQRQDGRAIGDQTGGGAHIGFAQPEMWIGRRVEVEDTADFLDPV
jgi:hypothetical protein